jgi:hypothetical protein
MIWELLRGVVAGTVAGCFLTSRGIRAPLKRSLLLRRRSRMSAISLNN